MNKEELITLIRTFRHDLSNDLMIIRIYVELEARRNPEIGDMKEAVNRIIKKLEDFKSIKLEDT